MSQTELVVENWMDILPPDYRTYRITSNRFDPAILGIYMEAKKLFPDLWVNFRNGIRVNNWCGYRTPSCAIGAKRSPHREGCALDLHSGNLDALRDWCTSPAGLEAGVKRVEAKEASPTWVHIDIFPPNPQNWKDRAKPYIFYP